MQISMTCFLNKTRQGEAGSNVTWRRCSSAGRAGQEPYRCKKSVEACGSTREIPWPEAAHQIMFQASAVPRWCQGGGRCLQPLCEVTSNEFISWLAHVCFSAHMILAGAGDSLQSCWRRESQRFDPSLRAVC